MVEHFVHLHLFGFKSASLVGMFLAGSVGSTFGFFLKLGIVNYFAIGSNV
jgi:hypothetical protein